MVNKENAALWSAELRSGKYKQCTGMLSDGVGYCCLGVLELLAKGELVNPRSGLPLIEVLTDWLGVAPSYEDINRSNFYINKGNSLVRLSDLNDNGHTFEQIADLIDTYLVNGDN